VGKGTAMAAIASVLPVASLQAMAQEKGPLEKKDLKIGFIPITCATPLIMADPLGFYKQAGPERQLTKTAGWALIRDKMMNKEYDATHFLSPMPLAISDGPGLERHAHERGHHPEHQRPGHHAGQQAQGQPRPEELEGLQVRDPVRVQHAQLPVALLPGRGGMNPDTDVQLRVVPPPEMVANLRAGNIDGFLGPDPFNQRAVFEEVGFIHVLTKEIWERPPLLRLRHQCRVHPAEPQHLRRAVPRGADRRRDGARPEEPRADRQGDRAGSST
jgi:nitrate/nitrite transport system substrate-binding protein